MTKTSQALLGLVTAFLSVALLFGSLAMALAEGGQIVAIMPSPTRTPTVTSTFTPPPTPLPGEPTYTSTPIPSPTPTATFPPPPTACPPPAGWIPFTVQPGDSLESLSQAYQTTSAAVIEANCLKGSTLITGMLLYLPSIPATQTPVPFVCTTPFGWIQYTIKSGDTLYRIAQLYGVTVAQLQQANCMGSSTLIRPGQKLWVPNVATRTPLPPTSTPVTPTNTSVPTPPPGTFSKLSPSNGASSAALSLTLDWGESTGAVGYEYCLDSTEGGTCTTSWVSTGTSSSVNLSGLSYSTTYYWQVRATNAVGVTYADGSQNSYWSFTTQAAPPAPGAFDKISPSNKAKDQSTSLTLDWNDSTGAAGYEYCYDTSNDDTCSSWISTATASSASVTGLSYSTTYYWQVRATNTGGTTYANGGETGFWSFTTQAAPQPPGAFEKISPSNNAGDLGLSLTLEWGNSTGVTSYEYCFDTSNDGTCGSWISTGTATSAGLIGLSYSTPYYWQVRAKNTGGVTYANGGETSYWSFTTQAAPQPPGAFNKLSPSNDASGQPTSLILDWNESTGATEYKYCIDNSDDGYCSAWISTGTTSSATLNGLSNGVTYYWQVRAENAYHTTYADGSESSYYHFTVQTDPPLLQ